MSVTGDDHSGLDLAPLDSSFDDDFLQSATPFFTGPSKATGESQVSSYLRQVENAAIEECNALLESVNSLPKIQSDTIYEHYIVYFHCPICLNSGFKTIQHIKQCASKNLMNPKDVISLLRRCPKTQRKKFLSNTKSNKTKAENKGKNKGVKVYELLILDEQHKQELVQKRVSKLLSSDHLRQRISHHSEQFLPISWKLSHLTFDSRDYVIDDFSKYFH